MRCRAPSSRGALVFARRATAPNRAATSCSICPASASLFPAPDLRDGYLRADPGDPAAVLRAVLKARDLVGTFDKPRYIAFSEDLCAHSRSRIVGCRRCLDLCPAGAIAPAGDHVAIDAAICAGCGQCAAACPTGAAAYALPPADFLLRKLRALLTAYREAGGKNPILLLHDNDHGGALIDALARHGAACRRTCCRSASTKSPRSGSRRSPPPSPMARRRYGILLRAKPRHDLAGLRQTIGFAAADLTRARLRLAADDRDRRSRRARRGAARDRSRSRNRRGRRALCRSGAKREVLMLTLRELHGAAPAPVDVIALPAGAPFGAVEIDAAGCTLCLACVAACPTGALSDDPERPLLRFKEDACVQCGLCKATCPEKVITLKPQLDFRAATAPARVLKEEEPFICIRCAKPFGVKSTIERVSGKLEGRHWMYERGSKRLDLIKMCEDCRIAVVTEDEFDPHAAPPRPDVRTTDDYLRERVERERAEKGES